MSAFTMFLLSCAAFPFLLWYVVAATKLSKEWHTSAAAHKALAEKEKETK